LSWDWIEVAILVITELNPFMWETAVVLEVVEWLKREPVSLVGRWVSVVDAQLQEELLDVQGGEELSLTIDDNLSGWLAWDRVEWLHDFGVWIGHTFSLPRVEALVDIWIPEVVLADDSGIFIDLVSVGGPLHDS